MAAGRRIEPARFAAVFFDLDGVLVDSMPNHARAWVEMFRRHGREIDPLWPRLREGEKALPTCRWICERIGLDWDEATCAERVEEKRRIFRALPGTEPFPAVEPLLAALAMRGLRLGLVTGSTVVNARAVLPEALWRLFRVRVAAEDVANGKPHPEPWQQAANKLKARPEDCLAVENAPLGIRSAKAAGCRTLALTTTLPAAELAEADEVADGHFRVLELALGPMEA